MTESGTLEKRFVVDVMMGKLAKWLRVLGFDTRCQRLDRLQTVERFSREGFLILTRSRRWSEHPRVYFLSSNDPMEQLREVMARIPVAPEDVRLLHRCIRCNERLDELARSLALSHVPDYVFETNISFYHCPKCNKVYWSGSHPRRMIDRLQDKLGWSVSMNEQTGG
jgi:uncharacterized protein